MIFAVPLVIIIIAKNIGRRERFLMQYSLPRWNLATPPRRAAAPSNYGEQFIV